MELVNRYVNYALVLLALMAPFVVMYGCDKQEKMEIARRGQ